MVSNGLSVGGLIQISKLTGESCSLFHCVLKYKIKENAFRLPLFKNSNMDVCLQMTDIHFEHIPIHFTKITPSEATIFQGIFYTLHQVSSKSDYLRLCFSKQLLESSTFLFK